MRKVTGFNCVWFCLSLIAIAFLSFTVALLYSLSETNLSVDQAIGIPLAINTWAFSNATSVAWNALFTNNLSAVNAVELGCSVCEQEQCDFTVGYGGSPDESGETTLDAFIMDGETMNVGAVAALRNVKSAISVARHVMEYTEHSILAGELATRFAIDMGFLQENLTTNVSVAMYKKWKSNNCQPNYWTNVSPDPSQQCGPYSPISSTASTLSVQNKYSHDTISMIALDLSGKIAVGTSSNGAIHKIPGRVGDAPLVGAGGYADGTVGAAACTGDGDVMMRFLPSFLAVEEMRRGASPKSAAQTAISRIKQYYPSFQGAIIAVNVAGNYAASCHGLSYFPYSVHSTEFPSGRVVHVTCI